MAAKIVASDPCNLLNYLYKKVKITSNSGKNFVGVVYSINPVTLTFVVLSSQDQTKQHKFDNITFLIGDNIASLEVIDHNVGQHESISSAMDSFMQSLSSHPNKVEKLEEKDIMMRKNKMLAWFKKNHIPVDGEGSTVVVAGMVEIVPPYEQNNCMCSNPIVLEKFQKMTAQIEKSY